MSFENIKLSADNRTFLATRMGSHSYYIRYEHFKEKSSHLAILWHPRVKRNNRILHPNGDLMELMKREQQKPIWKLETQRKLKMGGDAEKITTKVSSATAPSAVSVPPFSRSIRRWVITNYCSVSTFWALTQYRTESTTNAWRSGYVISCWRTLLRNKQIQKN